MSDNQTDLSPLKAQAETALEAIKRAGKIADETQYEWAKAEREALSALKAKINSAFDPQIKAAHAAHKAALAAAKSFLEPVEAADAILKRAVASYEQELRAKAEEDRRIAEEMGAADLLPTIAIPAGTTYMRTIYSAEVVDIVALARAVVEGLVSPELILPNQPALNALASSAHEIFSVPGCKLVTKEVPCNK